MLRSLLIKNNLYKDNSNSHVVYKYSCEKCQPSKYYIGYTTTTLKQRALSHTQNGSIKNHNTEEHHKKIKTADILPHMSILHRSTIKSELQLAEALSSSKTKNHPSIKRTKVIPEFYIYFSNLFQTTSLYFYFNL